MVLESLMDLVPPQEAPPRMQQHSPSLSSKINANVNSSSFTAFHVTLILVGILVCVVMCAIPWDNMKCCNGERQQQQQQDQHQEQRDQHSHHPEQVILQVIHHHDSEEDGGEDEQRKRRRPRGLSKKVIQSFKVIRYHCQSNKVSSSECIICLGEFRNGQKVRLLPGCSHGFHKKCIQQWLISHTSCPICRNALVPQSPDEKLQLQVQQQGVQEHLQQEHEHQHAEHVDVIVTSD